MSVDIEKARRELIRWIVLLALNNGRPFDFNEEGLQAVVRAVYSDITALELRRQLDYLEGCGLIAIKKSPSGSWAALLTRKGIDTCEYTIDCEPGIDRPAKYW